MQRGILECSLQRQTANTKGTAETENPTLQPPTQRLIQPRLINRRQGR